MIKGFNGWLLESASYISSIKDEDIVAATIIGEAGGEEYSGLLKEYLQRLTMTTLKLNLLLTSTGIMKNGTTQWI